MTLITIWLIGWVVTSLIITIGASISDWNSETKSNFTFRAVLLGILLWPVFAIILVGFMIGLSTRRSS